jgi:hypothetical protein
MTVYLSSVLTVFLLSGSSLQRLVANFFSLEADVAESITRVTPVASNDQTLGFIATRSSVVFNMSLD